MLDILFPPKCAACGEITCGKALCESCYSKYLAECTSRSVKTEAESTEKTETDNLNLIDAVIYLTVYRGYHSSDSGVTERLIYALKYRKNERLADFFASDIASRIIKHLATHGIKKEDCVLTYPPRSERNLRKYGFDHAELLCTRISRFSGIPCERLLVRDGGTEQKKLTPLERRENVDASLSASREISPKGKRVILVDDVITTGATACKSAELLKDRRAQGVSVAAIAKTENKKGS